MYFTYCCTYIIIVVIYLSVCLSIYLWGCKKLFLTIFQLQKIIFEAISIREGNVCVSLCQRTQSLRLLTLQRTISLSTKEASHLSSMFSNCIQQYDVQGEEGKIKFQFHWKFLPSRLQGKGIFIYSLNLMIDKAHQELSLFSCTKLNWNYL